MCRGVIGGPRPKCSKSRKVLQKYIFVASMFFEHFVPRGRVLEKDILGPLYFWSTRVPRGRVLEKNSVYSYRTKIYFWSTFLDFEHFGPGPPITPRHIPVPSRQNVGLGGHVAWREIAISQNRPATEIAISARLPKIECEIAISGGGP